MENQVNVQNQGVHAVQEPLPNSTAILIMGIISIAMCWCYGVIGVALGIIAVVMAKKSTELYAANPGKYTESSYKNMKAGKICAIIGLCTSGLVIIGTIIYIMTVGFVLSAFPWDTFLQQVR